MGGGYTFPSGMAETYTHGGSFGGQNNEWCVPLEKHFRQRNARAAIFWTVTKPWQVVTNCGNGIILGHTLFHYSKTSNIGWSFKHVVDRAKIVANVGGFKWATSARRWCT